MVYLPGLNPVRETTPLASVRPYFTGFSAPSAVAESVANSIGVFVRESKTVTLMDCPLVPD